jgi:hypothetical protein
VVELFLIDDEEAVMDVLNTVNGNGWVLRVMFIEVKAE